MKADLRRPALALLALTGLAGAVSAQAALEERLASVRAAYAVESWPAGPVRDGLPLGTLELAGFRGGPLSSIGSLVGRDFVAADAPRATAPAFHVEAQVFDDAAGAREMLVGWLAGLTSPTLAPEDGAFGVELGDAGYVGPSGSGPRVFSWVAFVRGNVAVRLLNVDPARTPAPPLLELAGSIDAAIARRAHLAADAPLPRPEIATLAAGAAESTVIAGQRVKLDVTVTDPAGGTPTLQWSVGGDGQGYVEARADGWYLFTTGPGTVTVTLSAIGSTATLTERSLQLHVADD